jgi:RNA polymerase primary sigma factor
VVARDRALRALPSIASIPGMVPERDTDMNTMRSSPAPARFAELDRTDTEVLTTRDERSLLQELGECKRKLAEALSGIEGFDVPGDAGPQATAQCIAAAYSSNGREQARLGVVYRRYAELRSKLALANLKLVAHVAKRFRERGIPHSDLMQEGFCGLLEAIDRFDVVHQTKLATYATWWIRQSMQRAVASGAYPVRLTPRHLRQLAQNHDIEHHLQLRDRETESSQRNPLPRNKLIDRIHTATQPAISLDANYDSSSSFRLIQSMSDPEGDRTIDIDTEETIEKLMNNLRPREQEVLALRFGLGGRERLSLAQAGRILAVSKERVRQIEERALTKLRSSALVQQFCDENLSIRF